jgi:hypothetical protein
MARADESAAAAPHAKQRAAIRRRILHPIFGAANLLTA